MLQVSSSPHIRDSVTTRRLMLDVVIALIPAIAASTWIFGWRSLVVIALTTGSAVIFEYLSRIIMKRYNSIGDLSAIVTGLLLAMNLPPTIPLWIPVVGSFIAIVIVKQIFGGIGQNFLNPALASRVILMLSYPAAMTRWAILADRARSATTVAETTAGRLDLIATATPLYIMQNHGTMPRYLDMFIGLKGGCIGEVSVLALLIGATYLIVRKVINLWIPLTYIGTVAVITAIAGQNPLYHVLSAGLIIGAFFMATDYVTAPVTRNGQIVFAIGCGIITALIRLFGSMTEGVSFAILLMNILTPHIENWTKPVPFGSRKGGRNYVKG
jgi:electron transport complex protein RnfD